MTVHEIVRKYLEDNGFDGLYIPGMCACRLDDLIPCCGDIQNCEAGYSIPCSDDCGGHGIEIGPDKSKDGK